MNKGLEALGKITGTQNLTMYEQNECLKIIEKELKDYYLIKNILDDFGLENPQNLIDNLKIINSFEKELKSLEILKKEPFISANWYLEGTYEEYVNAIEVVKITKDEWNIVKEVLKWKQIK